MQWDDIDDQINHKSVTWSYIERVVASLSAAQSWDTKYVSMLEMPVKLTISYISNANMRKISYSIFDLMYLYVFAWLLYSGKWSLVQWTAPSLCLSIDFVFLCNQTWMFPQSNSYIALYSLANSAAWDAYQNCSETPVIKSFGRH